MNRTLTLVIPVSIGTTPLLSKIQADIEQLGVRGAWYKPERFHLELNYLGRLPESETPRVVKAIFGLMASQTAFSLSLDYLQTLYSRHGPTTIYLSPHRNEQLRDLQAGITTTLKQIKIPQPVRFLPQLVIGELARADPTTTKQNIDKLAGYELPELVILSVTRVNLLEVFFHKKSVHYQNFATFGLFPANP